MHSDTEISRARGSKLTHRLTEAADKARARPDAGGNPYGAHVAEVVIGFYAGDPWGDHYTLGKEFGYIINPMPARAQLHRGVARGIGQALADQVGYDARGQLLTASLMDYALPRAAGIPMIRFTSAPVPSTSNPMGMKEYGDSGTVGALAAM